MADTAVSDRGGKCGPITTLEGVGDVCTGCYVTERRRIDARETARVDHGTRDRIDRSSGTGQATQPTGTCGKSPKVITLTGLQCRIDEHSVGAKGREHHACNTGNRLFPTFGVVELFRIDYFARCIEGVHRAAITAREVAHSRASNIPACVVSKRGLGGVTGLVLLRPCGLIATYRAGAISTTHRIGRVALSGGKLPTTDIYGANIRLVE